MDKEKLKEILTTHKWFILMMILCVIELSIGIWKFSIIGTVPVP